MHLFLKKPGKLYGSYFCHFIISRENDEGVSEPLFNGGQVFDIYGVTSAGLLARLDTHIGEVLQKERPEIDTSTVRVAITQLNKL